MNTVEVIRAIVGVVFIIFGLGVYLYDKLHHMKYSEFRYSPISWLICILAGVYAMAYTVKVGIICGVVTLILWVTAKTVVLNLIEKRSI